MLSLLRTGSLSTKLYFISHLKADTMATGKQTHEMIAVARKGLLEGLNASAFELGKIQK